MMKPEIGLEHALRAGDPDAVREAIRRGEDIHFRNANGYDALLNAVQGRDVERNSRLLELLQLLVEQGVALSGITSHAESGLRVLSRLGLFDAVRLLLSAGADEAHLEWTPLMKSVAIGSVDDVRAALSESPNLERRDWWERTAWLIALTTGNIAKAQLLLESGADTAARGCCGAPPLFHAIRGHAPHMVRWLIQHGADVEEKDKFGDTALVEAVEHDDVACVDVLLEFGADVHIDHNGPVASDANSLAMCKRLLEAGVDPAHINQRIMLGLPEEDERELQSVSASDYQKAKTRAFGRNNPEVMRKPFWEAMIRAGVNAYTARKRFEGGGVWPDAPTWCASRFGQSLTELPDGRAVQIAGEHEDHYDPDFCIYNDVFEHHPDGKITIYGYPESVFPPTDFHTATLVGEFIYIIGSLGYPASRQYGHTPVYRLNTTTFVIEPLTPSGHAPGWIYEHRAELYSPDVIRISGGTILNRSQQTQSHRNERNFDLDLRRMRWTT